MERKMTKIMKKLVIISLFLCAEPTVLMAADNSSHGLRDWLSTIVKSVPNPKNVPCNGLVDCREKGQELDTVYQMNQNNSYAASDYPKPCYKLGKHGKYVYSHSGCQ
jgi:hypothetical protein